MHHLYGNRVSGRNRICSTGTNSSWNNFTYIVLALYHCGCYIKEWSHAAKFLGRNSDQNYLLSLLNFQDWMGFRQKFCSPIQNNIGPNFNDGQNFGTYEHSLMVYFHLRLCFEDVIWHASCTRITKAHTDKESISTIVYKFQHRKCELTIRIYTVWLNFEHVYLLMPTS